jgi:hypothetical protein
MKSNKAGNIKGRTFDIYFIVVAFILLQFACCIYDDVSRAMIYAEMNAAATRGRDIHVSITNANEKRKVSLLPPIWPKTRLVSTNIPDEISGKVFKTSTEYFATLYDEEHVGTQTWKPWIQNFDYSKLAGAGVPAKEGKGKLLAKNNMWLIAANITEEDSDLIPVLITRNVDVKAIEHAINCGITSTNFDTKIDIGNGDYKTPFGKKAIVLVRKGGGVHKYTQKYSTMRVLFNGQELPPRDPSKQPIVYLLP